MFKANCDDSPVALNKLSYGSDTAGDDAYSWFCDGGGGGGGGSP